MKKLTKLAIAGTLLSAAALYVTGGVTQALVTDGNHCFCIVSWHIPFYRTVQLTHSAWWIFTTIWLVSLLAPPILWVAIGIRQVICILNGPMSHGHEVTARTEQ